MTELTHKGKTLFTVIDPAPFTAEEVEREARRETYRGSNYKGAAVPVHSVVVRAMLLDYAKLLREREAR